MNKIFLSYPYDDKEKVCEFFFCKLNQKHSNLKEDTTNQFYL